MAQETLMPLGSFLCALPVVIVIICSHTPSHCQCLAAWVASLTIIPPMIHLMSSGS